MGGDIDQGVFRLLQTFFGQYSVCMEMWIKKILSKYYHGRFIIRICDFIYYQSVATKSYDLTISCTFYKLKSE